MLAACLLAGMLMRRMQRVPENAHVAMLPVISRMAGFSPDTTGALMRHI